ncbi:MAG: SAM-dependent methyltransferase, partial [Acidimicrobiia bacterium]
TLGLSPLATGFSLTPLALAMVVAAVATAPVGRRMGLRWTITAGLALVLASSLTFALLGPEGPLPLVLALALLGAGFGLANAPAIEAVMTALPGERAGVASALNFSTRNSGLALGIAVMGSVMSGVYRDRLAAAPDIGTAEVRQAAQQSISAALGLAERLGGDGGLRLADAATTAYAGGVRTAGWVGAIVSLAGIGVALAFVPRRLAGAVRTPAPATAARARQGGPHMTEWPDSPVGRQVRWLLEAWVGEDEVPTEAASARWAPTLTFDRFSSGSSLLDPATRAAWRAEGRSRRPVARTMVVDSPHQMCLELESGDGARSWHGFVVEPDPPHRLALHYGMDTAATGERGASSTMQMGALGRAAHLVDDVPHVFDDHLAPVLLTSEYRARLPREPRRGPMFLTAVIRARLAEDVVEAAYARGGRQYVLLGAGLDSFAYRRTDLTGLRVFEVDEPVSQAWKRDRLRQVGIDEPPDLTFVPVDFDTQRLDEQLLAAGFDPRQPAAFSLLGVSGYISPAALADTLSTVGRRDGNELVFDYHCRSLETDFDRLLRAVVRASGEVNDTAYEPEEISALLAEHGFEVVADLAPDEATARYFAGRPDGLAVKGMTRLVHARRAQV